MALSIPTLLDTKTLISINTSLLSSSIAPSADALLVVIASARRGVSPMPSFVSITKTGLANVGAWTVQQEVQATTVDWIDLVICTAKITGAGGSGQLEIHWNASGGPNRAVMHILEVTGYDTSTPVAQSNQNSGTANTLAVTLGATPAATSLVIGAVCSRSATAAAVGVTPGGNYTELVESFANATNTVTQEVEYDQDNASATVDWSTLNTDSNLAVAIEVKAAGAGGNLVYPRRMDGLGVYYRSMDS